ncbi:hypothetical protein [Halioxenophilus aromaticivorans]|uniref:Lipoprotein n=1 Tax=Halioxenophilus aromaticivorans TaxID=1306992 RepID=A0AAV3U1P7_9ALTE
MRKLFFILLVASLLPSCATTNAPLNFNEGDRVVVVNNLDDTFMVQWAGLTVFDSAKDNIELGYSRSQAVTEYVKSKSNSNVYFDVKDVPQDGKPVHYLHIKNSQECAGMYCSYYLPGSGIFGNNFNRWAMSTLVFTLTDQPTRVAEESRYYFKIARVKTSITKKKVKKKAEPTVFKDLMQCIDDKVLDLAMYYVNQSMPLFHSVAVPEGKQSIKKNEVSVNESECRDKL